MRKGSCVTQGHTGRKNKEVKTQKHPVKQSEGSRKDEYKKNHMKTNCSTALLPGENNKTVQISIILLILSVSIL